MKDLIQFSRKLAVNLQKDRESLGQARLSKKSYEKCRKWKAQYIGESHRTLQDRFLEHLGYVRNNHTKKATGEHFNSKGHKQSDMTITIIEKVHNNSNLFRKQRERMFISKFNTKYKGMNRIT